MYAATSRDLSLSGLELDGRDRRAEQSSGFRAVEALALARTAAAAAGLDPWQFAVELSAPEFDGVPRHALRLLLAQGLAEHRQETTAAEAPLRTFIALKNLSLPEGTCLVLTDQGARWVAQRADESPEIAPGHPPAAARRPSWDRDHRVLRWQGAVVKSFRVPAPQQEAILEAFERAGWPPCIADPLTALRELEPRLRLANVIKGLNRSHQQPRIRFFGDGTGRRVCWRAAESNGEPQPPRSGTESVLDRPRPGSR